jgi:hypothetical protein
MRDKLGGNKKKSRNQRIGGTKTTTTAKEDQHPNHKQSKISLGT